MSYAALGQPCGPCTFWSGTACLPCPHGSTMPQCEGCVGGRPPKQGFLREYGTELSFAIASAVAVGLVAPPLVEALRKKVAR